MSKRIETGVMVLKNGKAWGVKYEDGRSTEYGWIDPCLAPIHDPRYCKKPTDVTWDGSPYINELSTAEVISVQRTTTVHIVAEMVELKTNPFVEEKDPPHRLT